MAMVSVGLSGGSNRWSFNQSGDAVITEIVIRHGYWIDSLTFTYLLGGQSSSSQMFGGVGGRASKIKFNSDIEYITGISGWHRDGYVQSLTVHTNVTTYGTYGRPLGVPFEMLMQGRKISGFFGQAGDYLNAIGVYINPVN